MAAPADVIFVDGEVHTLADPDQPAEALAVRDGRVVRVADTYEIEFLEGVETTRIDLDGRTAVPGFVDAHAHLLRIGFRRRRADLSDAPDRDTALDRLRADADRDREWVLGFGFDETAWPAEGPLSQADLDAVSADRPVAAFARDGRTVVCNSVAADRLSVDAAGVCRWPDSEAVWQAIAPDRAGTRGLIEAGLDHAVANGVTTVYDDVRTPATARAYQDLAADGDLPLRVRVNYHHSSLDAIEAAETLGVTAGTGDDRLGIAGVRVDVDGSIADGTAWLAEADAGQNFVDADALAAIRDRAAQAGLPVRVRASGDAALDAVLDVFEDHPVVDRADVVRDEQIPALADVDAVVVAWPDAMDVAPADGQNVGRYGRLRAAGVTLALGSDGFRTAPLSALERLQTAGPEQRLATTEALQAATWGGQVGDPLAGTLAVGAPADIAILSGSPWADPAASLDVELTVVDGEVVFEAS